MRVIERARRNARRAGIGELVDFDVKDVAQLNNPLPKGPYGTVISNPPYGERLESEPALIALHSLLGRIMKSQFGGWNLSVFSASPELLSCLQLRADKQFKAKNGPLDCVQKNYHLAESEGGKPAMLAEDFANRLRKNLKKFEKWARQEGIECYRLYDADLPEYNVAIDRYADWVVVQEYAPPKTVDAHKARQRLFDINGRRGKTSIRRWRRRATLLRYRSITRACGSTSPTTWIPVCSSTTVSHVACSAR